MEEFQVKCVHERTILNITTVYAYEGSSES